jgi:hypothetical protein
MCNPNDPSHDELLVRALASYLDDSVSQEFALRDLLEQTQHNNPDLSVGECVSKLVQDYLILRGDVRA